MTTKELKNVNKLFSCHTRPKKTKETEDENKALKHKLDTILGTDNSVVLTSFYDSNFEMIRHDLEISHEDFVILAQDHQKFMAKYIFLSCNLIIEGKSLSYYMYGNKK